MPTRNVKLRVELDGEKQYKEAIAEINRENKTLGAEMRKLAAEYKGNENSIEALTQKQTLLDRQLLEQDAKVEATRKQLESWRVALERVRVEQGASSEEYKAAQKKVQEYEAALANAEATQFNMQHAVEENRKAVEDQEKSLEQGEKAIKKYGDEAKSTGGKVATLGDQVDDIADKFGVKIPGGIKNALDKVQGFSTGTVVAMGAAVAAIGGVQLAIKGIGLAVDGVKTLNEWTLDAASKADDLLTRSAQTGLDTTFLQQLDYASKFVDFDGVDKSLIKLTQNMGTARDQAISFAEAQQKAADSGNVYEGSLGSQAAAFENLGISVTNADGSLRDSWDVFMESIDALGQIENATERDVAANDLFGKSYSDLKPLIDAGSEGLQEFMDEALESGTVLDESQIQKLGEVDDAYQEYQARLEETKNKLAVEFAPVSMRVMEIFGDYAEQAGDRLSESGILETLGDFLDPLGDIMGSLLDIGGTLLPMLVEPLNTAASLFNTLAGAVGWAAQKISALANAIFNVDWGKLGAMNNSAEYGFGINAGGTDNWRGGLTWVGEAGPELISLPSGTQIHTNQESRAIAGGGNTYNIYVQNIDELQQIVDFFDSLRIRGRMA